MSTTTDLNNVDEATKKMEIKSPQVTLITTAKKYSINGDLLMKFSGTYSNMVSVCHEETCDVKLECDDIIIEKIIGLMNYHDAHYLSPKPPKNDEEIDKMFDDLDQYDVDFIENDLQVMFDVLNVADFLDSPVIKKLALMGIASKINGKSSEEIKELLFTNKTKPIKLTTQKQLN